MALHPVARILRASSLQTAIIFVTVMFAPPSLWWAQAATLDCETALCPNTSPATLCSVSTADPQASNGDVIDCTGFDVEVGSQKIRVNDGSLKLIADSVHVLSSGKIEAKHVSGGVPLGVAIETTGNVQIEGVILATGNDGGGTVTIDAGGDIDIDDAGGNPGIDVTGTAANASGGSIELTSGGSIYIDDPLLAHTTTGGTSAVGGRIVGRAATDILVASSGTDLRVEGYRDDSGVIRLTAGGDIDIGTSTTLDADGRNSEGNGGEIQLTAGGQVTVTGLLLARGGANAGGELAMGGSVHIESGCDGVTLNSDIDVRAGQAGGGDAGGALAVETDGDLTIASGVKIKSFAVGDGGSGGDIQFEVGGKITIGANAEIDAHGDTSGGEEGLSGSVDLRGCELDIGSGAKVIATGFDGGNIMLAASNDAENYTSMFIAATSEFDATGDTNGYDGDIEVLVGNEDVDGTCSTDPTLSCTLDVDCTVGCDPGTCDGLNPDTDEVLTQFISTPELGEQINLTGCATECGP